MISDRDTNMVYFSKRLETDLRFSETCTHITNILRSNTIKYDFLHETKDIWARDYMPIQISDNKYIEYRYDPDYLQGTRQGYRDLKTYPDIVCSTINLKTVKSGIILDGGNVVKSSNCVILTDKIVKENRLFCSKSELIGRLKDLFEVDFIVLIPWDTIEEYGHSDGILRFIDDTTVLVSGIYESDKKLLFRLKQSGLNWEFLRFNLRNRDRRNWAYINFLQTKDLILLPKFDIEEDNQALDQIKNYFPDYEREHKIFQVDMTQIVKYGGALNCITWTIKS